MKNRTKKIAMLLSAVMLVNSVDGSILVSAADEAETKEVTAEESVLLDALDSAEDDMEEETDIEMDDEEILLDSYQQENGEVVLDEIDTYMADNDWNDRWYEDGDDEDEEETVWSLSYKEHVKAPIGEKITLKVEVKNDPGDLTYQYQWYYEDENDENIVMESENATFCQVLSDSIEEKSYMCEVTDSNGKTHQAWFHVTGTYNYGTLQCAAVDTEQPSAKKGEKLTLSVWAVTTLDQKISYVWKKRNEDYEWEVINGATTDTYESIMEESGEYLCEISDGVSTDTIEFNVSLDNDVDETIYRKICVEYGKNVELNAETSDITGNISYKWYCAEEVYWLDNEVIGRDATLVGDPVTQKMYYKCVAEGDNKSIATIFTVKVKTDLVVSAQEKVATGEDGRATLTVNASTSDTEHLTYKWIGFYDYYEEEPTVLGTEATYTTARIENCKIYFCEVSDSYNTELVMVIAGKQELLDNVTEDWEHLLELPSDGSANTIFITHYESKYDGNYLKFVPDKTGYWEMKAKNRDANNYFIYDSEKQFIGFDAGDGVEAYLTAGKEYDIYVQIGNGCVYTPEQYTTRYLGENGTGKHEWNITSIKEATCTETGYRWLGCTQCMARWREEIPATGKHSYTDWTIEKEANCKEEGKEYRICEKCGEKETRSIAVNGTHIYGNWTVGKKATCIVEGIEYRTCTRCGEKEERSIPKTGHTFGDYQVTMQPTVLAAGVKTRTCSVCGQKENMEIPKLNGTVQLSTNAVPLENKKTVQISSIVSGLSDGDYIVSYKSDNTKVAIVDAKGKVTGKSNGTANITITLASGATASVKITVQKKAVMTSKITGVPGTLKLSVGQKQKLTPVITPISSKEKVTYTSSNKKVVTVASNGTITAKKSGTAKITVKSGKKKVTVKVTVAKKAPTGMSGIPSAKTLKKGKAFTLKAKLTPAGAEAKITYKSSNKGVATVDGKGKVKAKKAGTAVITVTAGTVKKTCTVTVK